MQEERLAMRSSIREAHSRTYFGLKYTGLIYAFIIYSFARDYFVLLYDTRLTPNHPLFATVDFVPTFQLLYHLDVIVPYSV